MKKNFIITITLSLLLLSCLTVPPNREGGTLLVIKSTYSDLINSGIAPFGHICLKTKKDGKTYEIKVDAKTGYIFYRFLPQGTYTDWDVCFEYNDNRETRKESFYQQVTIARDTITIFPIEFEMIMYKDNNRRSSGDWQYMTYKQYPLTDKNQNEMLEIFKNDRNLYTWNSVYIGNKTVFEIRHINMDE